MTLRILQTLLLAAVASAEGTVRIGQVMLGEGSDPRPTALRRLAWEVDKRTSVDIAAEPAPVQISDEALFDHPLLWLSGDRAFDPPPEEGVARLRRHLTYGGILVVDDAEARPGGGFDRSARALVARLFPGQRLAPVARDHALYKSFYLLADAPGRALAAPDLEAVERDGRLVVVYSQNDLGGAWARDPLGGWRFEVVPGGERQREMAFRVGINVVMYTLCLDYKDDQVHVPFILKRRRWRVDE